MKFFDTLKNSVNQVASKAKSTIVESPFDIEMVEPEKKASKPVREDKKPTPIIEVGKDSLSFESVTKAAEYLSSLFNLKITNSKDCIYKALKGTGKTHGFNVGKSEDGKIILNQII